MNIVAWANSAVKGLVVAAIALAGCGGARLQTKIVETPSSRVVSYGAPRDMKYTAEVDPALGESTITVYQSAKCDVISVQLFDRYEEKRRGDEVVEKTLLGKRQQAGAVTGSIDCAQTYAARVHVMVDVDGAHFPLGDTDAHGRVTARWAELFKTAAMGVPQGPAQLLVRPLQAQPMVAIGTISFEELKRQEKRLTQLLGELGTILDAAAAAHTSAQTPAHLSQEDSRRAYELYAQIQQLAPHDPRTTAMATRFWELVYARKQTEWQEALERNLGVLSQAKDTLKAMGNAAIPLYVQAAVSSGAMDARALDWASLRLLSVLQNQRTLCVAGVSQVPSLAWPTPEAQLAAQYFQYGYGASAGARLTAICGTLW